MEKTVKYQGIISGYHAANRVESAFGHDTLTGLNILVSPDYQVTLHLVFNDPDRQPDPDLLLRVIQDGEVLEPEVQGALPGLGDYAFVFLGDGFPAFQVFFKSLYNRPLQANNSRKGGS